MDGREQRAAFVRALEQNPDDDVTRLVFADFLDENDEPEEAQRMRDWRSSKDWLVGFANRCGRTCLNYGYDPPEDDWCEITFDDVIKAGHGWVDDEDYFTQMGSKGARDLMGDPGTVKAFWHNWAVVTGRPTPLPDEYGLPQPFSCSC